MKGNIWPFPIQKFIYYDNPLCLSNLINLIRIPGIFGGKIGLFKTAGGPAAARPCPAAGYLKLHMNFKLGRI